METFRLRLRETRLFETAEMRPILAPWPGKNDVYTGKEPFGVASLGTLLVDAGFITQKQFDEALQSQVLFGGSIGTNLIELGYLDEDKLSQALSKQLGIPTALADRLEKIQPDVIATIPQNLAREYYSVPFAKDRDELSVAMADPRDPVALQQLALKTGLKIRPHVVPEVRISYLLEKFYGIRREQRYLSIAKPAQAKTDTVSSSLASQIKSSAANPDEKHEAFGRVSSGKTIPPAPVAPPVPEQPKVEEPAREPVPRPRRITPAELADMVKSVKSRDDIANIILEYTQGYLKRAVLFVVKRDIAFGWAGFGDKISPETVRGLMLPLSQPSLFQLVWKSHGHYLGTVASSPINNRFFSAVGNVKPLTVIVLPVLYNNSLIALLYGDNGEGKGVSAGRAGDLQILTTQVAAGFEILLKNLRETRSTSSS